MSIIDLNSISAQCHTSASPRKEIADERWSDDLLSTDGLVAETRLSQLCRSLQRQLQDQELLVLGPVSAHGLRPAHLPGEPAGHPGLSAVGQSETLSHGHSREGLPQHVGPCQSGTRLADLRRLCSGAHRRGPEPLRQRLLRHRVGSERLCPGRNDDRAVPVALPLGHVPQAQGGCETPCPTGSAGQHPDDCRHYPWQGSRGQHPRRDSLRGGSGLCRGPRLSGLRSALPDPSSISLLRHPGQKQLPVPAALLSARGQGDRAAVRS
jgi:hypothetical protein